MRITLASSLLLCSGSLLACGADDQRAPDVTLDLGDRAVPVWVAAPEAQLVAGTLALHYRIETNDLDDVEVEVNLDAAGRGTVVMTSSDLRHEVKLDDKLFLVTYDRGTRGREVGYYARPRGDMLAVLAKRTDLLTADPDAMLANTPLHYVLLRTLDRLHADGLIDDRFRQLVRASDMLTYRYDFDPSIAPAPTHFGDAWRLAVEQQSVLGLADDLADTVSEQTGAGSGSGCPVLQPVSGSASILSTTTSVGGVVDVNCAAASVTIGALGPAGAGFAITNSGVTLNRTQSATPCPSDCSTGEIWPSCYQATVTGGGSAVVTPGAGFIGDGAQDTAQGPSCTIKSKAPVNLDVTVSAAQARNNATGGTATISLSASATWDEDLVFNDLCSAAGSGSANASLTGAGAPPVCPTPTPSPTPSPSPSPSPSPTPTTTTTTTTAH